jgi:hypothetical protein
MEAVLWKQLKTLDRVFAIKHLAEQGLFLNEISSILGTNSANIHYVVKSNNISVLLDPGTGLSSEREGGDWSDVAYERKIRAWRRARDAARRTRVDAMVADISDRFIKRQEITQQAPKPADKDRSRDVMFLSPSGHPRQDGLDRVSSPTGKFKRMSTIVDETAKRYRIPASDIMSNRRNVIAVAARHEVMYRMKHETALSHAEIGRQMGRDHTTIMSGVRKHELRIRARGELERSALQSDAA